MNLSDYLRVRIVLRPFAEEWECPVWMVKRIIQRFIDQRWEKALSDPEVKALWDKYFPTGKPTSIQYILRSGHAYKNGEKMPYLLEEQGRGMSDTSC